MVTKLHVNDDSYLSEPSAGQLPEIKLLYALLWVSIQDLVPRKQAGQKQVDQLNARRDKALLWFQNCYTTEGLSFPWVCEALDFNPFFIFQTLKKQGLIPRKLFYQPKGKCPWPDVIYFKTPDELAAVLNSQLGLFPATH